MVIKNWSVYQDGFLAGMKFKVMQVGRMQAVWAWIRSKIRSEFNLLNFESKTISNLIKNGSVIKHLTIKWVKVRIERLTGNSTLNTKNCY